MSGSKQELTNSLVLKIYEDGDPSLTCFICGEDQTDCELMVRPAYKSGGHKGRRVTIGAHYYCLLATQKMNNTDTIRNEFVIRGEKDAGER